MFSCTLSDLGFSNYASIEKKILDLEKLIASESARTVVDRETRAEIVRSITLRMGRVAHIRRLSGKKNKRGS